MWRHTRSKTWRHRRRQLCSCGSSLNCLYNYFSLVRSFVSVLRRSAEPPQGAPKRCTISRKRTSFPHDGINTSSSSSSPISFVLFYLLRRSSFFPLPRLAESFQQSARPHSYILTHTLCTSTSLFRVIHLPTLMLHLLYLSPVMSSLPTPLALMFTDRSILLFKPMSLWIGAVLFLCKIFMLHIWQIFFPFFFMCILLWQPWFLSEMGLFGCHSGFGRTQAFTAPSGSRWCRNRLMKCATASTIITWWMHSLCMQPPSRE